MRRAARVRRRCRRRAQAREHALRELAFAGDHDQGAVRTPPGASGRRRLLALVSQQRGTAAGLTAIEKIAATTSASSAFRRQDAQALAEGGEDERELADLREADRDRGRGARAGAAAYTIASATSGFTTSTMTSAATTISGCVEHEARVEQHAHRHEEERREHVAERRHVARRLRAEARLADHEARRRTRPAPPRRGSLPLR